MTAAEPDVLIVGAGPAGLMLAGDLATAGVRTTILEKRATGSNLSRAFVVHARTLEQLDARGLADDVLAKGRRTSTLRLFGARSDLSQLPSRFNYLLVIPQYEVEKVLMRRALDAGVRLVRGTEMIAMRQDADGVDVDARTADGSVETYRGQYLVGTDGVRSSVRKALDLPFPGRSAIDSVILADVQLTEQPPNVFTVNATRNGFAFMAPFQDRWCRLIVWDRHKRMPDDAPVELAEVAAIARDALGSDFGMHNPRSLSRFHSDERQSPQYRVGRVFLAGDAAHVHSPAGGQGMNTGLQDSANLSWKLAAAVRGWAGPGLLDTYQSERHPVGRAVLRSSGGVLRLVLADSPIERAVRAAFTTVVNLVPAIGKRVSLSITGLGFHYAAPRGSNRLAGRRITDLDLTGAPGRVYAALGGDKFLLLTPAGADAVAEPWADRVRRAVPVAAPEPHVLVRPDGYVAWAGSDEQELATALRDWCGAGALTAVPR